MPSPERATRYNTMSLPPPSLSKAVDALVRNARRMGGSLPANGTTIRRILKSADSEYDKRGRADDLYRFLRNQGILIEDTESKRYYVDSDQAEIVLEACERHSSPPDVPDQLERLALLRSPDTRSERDSGEYQITVLNGDDPSDITIEAEENMLQTHEPHSHRDSGNPSGWRLLSKEEFMTLSVDEATAYLAAVESALTEGRDLLDRLAELRTLEEEEQRLSTARDEIARKLAENAAAIERLKSR